MAKTEIMLKVKVFSVVSNLVFRTEEYCIIFIGNNTDCKYLQSKLFGAGPVSSRFAVSTASRTHSESFDSPPLLL